MPAPFALRQCGVLGAIDITLGRCERVELFQVELVFDGQIRFGRELRMGPFGDFHVRIVDERLAPDWKGNHHSIIGRLGCEFVKKRLIVRRRFVVETVSVAKNETIQEDQTLDAFGNCFRDFGNYRAAEAVSDENEVREIFADNVIDDDFVQSAWLTRFSTPLPWPAMVGEYALCSPFASSRIVESQAEPSCQEPCTNTKVSNPGSPEGIARPRKIQALRAGFAHSQQRLKDNGHALMTEGRRGPQAFSNCRPVPKTKSVDRPAGN